jgi:hypothetical protein
MVFKTHKDKNGNEWSWEETQETLNSLEELSKIQKTIKDGTFFGEYLKQNA